MLPKPTCFRVFLDGLVSMTEVFLSTPWLEALRAHGADLPEVDGVDIVIQHEITGAPDGKIRFYLEWVAGQLAAAEFGKHDDPDVVLQAKAPEALKAIRGEMSLDVGYMQGRLKVDGDYRRLLIDFRDWRTSEPYMKLWATMAELTTPE